jgi:hypothetical protein
MRDDRSRQSPAQQSGAGLTFRICIQEVNTSNPFPRCALSFQWRTSTAEKAIAIKLKIFVTHAPWVRGTNFQANPTSGSRDSGEKAYWSSSKVLYWLIDDNQTCDVCSACVERKKNPFLGKSLQCKPRFSRKGILLSKCPELLTDHDHTCTVCSASADNAKYDLSGKYLQTKPRWSRKCTLSCK